MISKIHLSLDMKILNKDNYYYECKKKSICIVSNHDC